MKILISAALRILGIRWILIIPVHHVCQLDSPKWHGPWWPAAMAAAARMHLQRERSRCWHRVTAAIHGGSLEIRATKPLITLWAHNPPAAPSEWNAISLLQLKLSGEQGEQGHGGTDRKWSYPCYHTVIVISTMLSWGGSAESWEWN